MSFFEKLKKGMGIEEPIIEEETEKRTEEKVSKKPKKIKVKKIEIQTEMPEEEKIEERTEKEPKEGEESKLSSSPFAIAQEQKEKKWPSLGRGEEGQLAIDVYQTENDLVIQSAIAGVRTENLDISMERDIITIKGSREKPFEENGDYFSQECFWGPFSREVILPAEVDPQRAMAEIKNGILTIRIPKILREKKRKIIVRE